MKGAGKFEPNSSKIVFEDNEEDEEALSCSSVSSSSDEEEETRKELTLEQIHKLRADGSRAAPLKPNQVKKTSRANKNRPMELSSKRLVSRYREVVQVPKKVVRDPVNLCSALLFILPEKRHYRALKLGKSFETGSELVLVLVVLAIPIRNTGSGSGGVGYNIPPHCIEMANAMGAAMRRTATH